MVEIVKPENAQGIVQTKATFSASTIRAAIKGQGVTGKELTRRVNEELRNATPGALGYVAESAASGFIIKGVVSGNRADGRKYRVVTMEEPKIGDSERYRLVEKRAEDAEAALAAFRKSIEDSANAGMQEQAGESPIEKAPRKRDTVPA